jgi:hypothetical protein
MGARIDLLVLVSLLVMASLASAQPVWFEGTGHYYDYIDTQMEWGEALLEAEMLSYEGLAGHLVTITSGAENGFLSDAFVAGETPSFAWIGGYEPGDDGTWLWGAGPESGIQFSQEGVPTPPYYYANWGGIEPNDFNPGEDFAAINIADEFAQVQHGEWIDSPNPNPSDPIHGYIVEYEMETGAGNEVSQPLSGLFLEPPTIHPTPSNGADIALRVALSQRCLLSVRAYGVAGRALCDPASAVTAGPGTEDIILDTAKLSSGLYFVRVAARPLSVPEKAEVRSVKLLVIE